MNQKNGDELKAEALIKLYGDVSGWFQEIVCHGICVNENIVLRMENEIRWKWTCGNNESRQMDKTINSSYNWNTDKKKTVITENP
jgi:hypothetical protein